MKKDEPKYLKPFEFETEDDEPKKNFHLPFNWQTGNLHAVKQELRNQIFRDMRGAFNIMLAIICLQISALIGYCLPEAAKNRAEYRIVEQARQEAQQWLILP